MDKELDMKEGDTLADLVNEVASEYGKEAYNYLYYNGKNKKVDPSINFFINGINARMLSGLNTKLNDNDVVAIIPPIGGG